MLDNFGAEPDNLVLLWTDCRHVSQQFRHKVEELFHATHLRRILIDFQMTSQYWSISSSGAQRIGYRDHEVLATFDRLSEDRSKAIFTVESEHGAKFLSRLTVETEPGDFGGAVHLRSLSGDLRTAPIFMFDRFGDVELDWKELLVVLFTEARHYYQVYLPGVLRLTFARYVRIRSRIYDKRCRPKMECSGYSTKKGNLFRASIKLYRWRGDFLPRAERDENQ